jgi:hypothetical protein
VTFSCVHCTLRTPNLTINLQLRFYFLQHVLLDAFDFQPRSNLTVNAAFPLFSSYTDTQMKRTQDVVGLMMNKDRDFALQVSDERDTHYVTPLFFFTCVVSSSLTRENKTHIHAHTHTYTHFTHSHHTLTQLYGGSNGRTKCWLQNVLDGIAKPGADFPLKIDRGTECRNTQIAFHDAEIAVSSASPLVTSICCSLHSAHANLTINMRLHTIHQ